MKWLFVVVAALQLASSSLCKMAARAKVATPQALPRDGSQIDGMRSEDQIKGSKRGTYLIDG